jgi:hypothetical protein
MKILITDFIHKLRHPEWFSFPDIAKYWKTFTYISNLKFYTWFIYFSEQFIKFTEQLPENSSENYKSYLRDRKKYPVSFYIAKYTLNIQLYQDLLIYLIEVFTLIRIWKFWNKICNLRNILEYTKVIFKNDLKMVTKLPVCILIVNYANASFLRWFWQSHHSISRFTFSNKLALES